MLEILFIIVVWAGIGVFLETMGSKIQKDMVTIQDLFYSSLCGIFVLIPFLILLFSRNQIIFDFREQKGDLK